MIRTDSFSNLFLRTSLWVCMISIGFCSLLTISHSEVVDRIVAKVGSDVITLSELEEAARQSEIKLSEDTEGQRIILNALIDRSLLVQEANKEKIEVPESRINAAVEQQITQIRKHFRTQAEYDAWLANQDVAPDEVVPRLKERVGQEILINQLLRKNTPVISEITIKRFADENPAEAQKQETVSIRHIFLSLTPNATPEDIQKTHDKALQIYHELKAGGNFEDLVLKYSEDSATQEVGGDLGYIHHGESLPEIEKVAFELDTNQISEPIKTDNGYHIIQVTDKASTREYLYQEAMKKTEKRLLSDLRSKTTIIIKI